jgi:hypothetical protein
VGVMTEKIDLFGSFGGTVHDVLREVAGESVVWDTNTGAAVILRHADVGAVAHDPRVAGVGLSLFDLMGIRDGPLRDWYGGIMFTNDGPAHDRLRTLVSRAFTPRTVEGLRRTAAGLAAEAMNLDGHADLVERFRLLPTRMMCRLLGVPDADVPMFVAWLDDLSPVFLMMTSEQIDAATRAIIELLGYVDDLSLRRRTDPGPDLVSALLAAEHSSQRRLGHDELVRMVANLLVAGHDTTTSQLGSSLFALLTHPTEAARARLDPELVTSLTAETTRLEPGIPAVPRTALEALWIGEHEIPPGSSIMLCFAAAHRDPAAWPDPERFDAERFTRRGVSQLLAYGAGAHYCLGAALARMTLEECLRAFLTAGEWELVEPVDQIPWRVVLGRAPQRLLVRPVTR